MLRLADADTLSQRVNASDSSALLKILGFEILLKSALRLFGVTDTWSHDYSKLWGRLPASTQQKLLAEARARMPGHTDFSNLPRLLAWYRFIFERARYHYELYEGYTDGEMAELGRLWGVLAHPRKRPWCSTTRTNSSVWSMPYAHMWPASFLTSSWAGPDFHRGPQPGGRTIVRLAPATSSVAGRSPGR